MLRQVANCVVKASTRTMLVSPYANNALQARTLMNRAQRSAKNAHEVAISWEVPAQNAKRALKVKQQKTRRRLIQVTANVAVQLAVHRVNFCLALAEYRALSAREASSKPRPAPRAVTCVRTAGTRTKLARHFVVTAGPVGSVMVRVVPQQLHHV